MQLYKIMHNDTLRLKPKPVEEDQKMIVRGPVHKSNYWTWFDELQNPQKASCNQIQWHKRIQGQKKSNTGHNYYKTERHKPSHLGSLVHHLPIEDSETLAQQACLGLYTEQSEASIRSEGAS